MVLVFSLALVAFGLLGTLYARLRFAHTALWRTHQESVADNARLKAQLTSADTLQKMLEQQIKALCAESMEKASSLLLKQSQAFFETYGHATDGKLSHHKEAITQMLAPFKETLGTMHEKINTLEKARVSAYEGLTEQIKGLSNVQSNLYKQTGQLLQALQTPNIRGRWGEIQLRRLVEWSGMLPFCDFLDQASFTHEERLLKPDLIIKLPFERHIIVDAKTPLTSYLRQAGTEAMTKASVQESVAHIKKHIQSLYKRDYTRYLPQTPDFVLLFLPTEALLIKALEEDPTLLDYSLEKAVLLTTPMTFIALLKMIALGWHQQSLSDNAQKISALGKELSAAFEKLTTHIQHIGRHLQQSTKAYNAFVDEVEEAVLPNAKELSLLSTSAPATHKTLKKIKTKERKTGT
ncbi:MAG: DNA recombination protein RmuC [Holosporaceae bacterium]